jgi:hypothetical protein
MIDIEGPMMVSKDFTEIARIISEADLVIGVFPDQQSPDCMGHVVIKGIPILHRTSELGVMTTLNKLTIPCDDREEAEAYRRVFGDAKGTR